METKQCTVCGARWINSQHYWATGKQGNELDLAGLVCNNLNDERKDSCINPCKGMEGGQTWDKRVQNLTAIEKEHDFKSELSNE